MRQAVRDLQDDFGFIIGRWNQAYQLDCCRDTGLPSDDPSKLVPGDLIFWRADYKNPNRKRQKFDCTHIEVFLGSYARCKAELGIDIPALLAKEQADALVNYQNFDLGNGGLDGFATIGSRRATHVMLHLNKEGWFNKPAVTYTVKEVLCRTLDTWLDGHCKGKEFEWRVFNDSTVGDSKFSAFAGGCSDDDSDE